MITEELLDFVRAQHEAHMSISQMKHLLLSEGDWDEADVDEALRTLDIQPTSSASEADDFLGIFSADEQTKKPEERPSTKTTPPPIGATPVIAAPQPSPAPPPKTEPLRVPPPQPSPTSSKPTFDLSLFRKNVASGVSSTTANAKAEDAVAFDKPAKTIKVSSFADMLQQGAEKVVEATKTKGPITWEGKTPLPKIRTMESDVLALNIPKVEPSVPKAVSQTPPKEAFVFAVPKEKATEKPAEKSMQKAVEQFKEEPAEKPAMQLEETIEEKYEAPAPVQMAEEERQEAYEAEQREIMNNIPPEAEEAGQEEIINAPIAVMPEIPASPAEEVSENPFANIFSFYKKSNVPEEEVQGGGAFGLPEKTINTKTIAEMWLRDAEDTVQGLTEAGSAQGEEAKVSVAEKRPSISDVLLRGKGKTIPGVPALFVPLGATKIVSEEESSEENIKKKLKEERDLKEHAGRTKEKQQKKNGATQTEATNRSHSAGSEVLPPVSPEVAADPFPHISRTPMEVVLPADNSKASPLETLEAFIEKKITKRVLPLVVGILIFSTLIIGALYLVLKLRGPDATMLLANASQQFYHLSAFGYQGSGSTNLVLSTATDGEREQGKIKFSLDYKGSLQSGNEGYGDGMHHVKFAGGFASNDLAWETDIEADVFVIGQTLYFRVLSFPGGVNADPELFKTYWVEVDLAEIAKELALDGLKTGLDEYGGFAKVRTTFNEALDKNFPFTVDERLADEVQGGVMSYRFHLKSDPVHMAELIRTIYRTYTNKELALNVDQELRFKDALAKIRGDVWINAGTGALVKFAFAGDLDDDVAGVHVKGPLAFDFTFADFNRKVTVAKPSPVLSLEELRVRMDDYKATMEKRTRDAPRIETLHSIEKALADYNKLKGRYPAFLSELVSANALVLPTAGSTTLKTYFYNSYVSGYALTKNSRCTISGKTCAFYHLGVNLEDTTNPELANDADKMGDIRGADAAGCGTEKGFACFDVVTPVAATSTSP